MEAYLEPQSENDILIVDDAKSNIVLLLNILQDSGYKVRTASNAEPAFIFIQEKLPTLILLDVRMPGMDGFEMCRILKAGKETCNIPVLMITAYEEEGNNILGLKAGASDFIYKPFQADELLARVKTNFEMRQIQLQLEAQNITLSNEIAERKQAEKELKESEIKFRNLFENSPVGKSITGIGGTLHVNKSFCDILGYSEDELRAKNWKEISYSEDIEKTSSIIRDLQEGKIKRARFEKRYIHKSGSIVWADVSTYLQQDQEDTPQYFITSINNITEQKQAEAELRASEEQLRTTLNSIGDGVITMDSEGMVRQMNPVAEQLTGWTEKEALGKLLEEVFPIINEDTRAAVEIPIRRVLREGIVVGLANHTLLIAKNGSERPIADSGAPIWNKEGEIIGVVLVFRDQSEERKAEFTLRESEKRFKLLYENAPLSYQSLDTSARLIDVNKTWLSTLGYNREEVIGRYFGEFMTPESAKLIKERFPAFIAAGEIHDFQFEMVKKDGTHFTVSYEGRIGHDELGHFTQTHCIFTDISERKRAEEVLAQEKVFVEAIFESIPGMLYVYDDKGTHIKHNKRHEEMTGYSDEELSQMNPLSWYDNKADVVRVEAAINDVFTKGYGEVDVPMRIKNGEKPIMHFTGSLLIMGTKKYFVGVGIDITERKQAEEEVREIETHFRTLADSGQALIWTSGLDKKCNYFNIPWLNFTGRTLEQELGDGWVEGVYPDDLQHCIEIYVNAFDCREKFSMEYRIRHSSGDYRWIQDDGTPRYDSHGKFIGYIGQCLDINESKLAKEELTKAKENAEKSKNYYEAIINNMGDPVFVKDDQSKLLLVNDAFCTIFNLSGTEIIGKTLAEGVAPDEQESFLRIDKQVLADGLDTVNEESVTIRDGQTRTISTRKSRFIGNDGEKYLIGVIRDISERKQAEEELLKIKNDLEIMVEEKTKELKERIAELERFYDATIDRELRMKELRDEIEFLKSGKL